MDKKDFIIGQVGRTKKILSKETWEKKRKNEVLQGGSRE
jgi:hypothetical protein